MTALVLVGLARAVGGRGFIIHLAQRGLVGVGFGEPFHARGQLDPVLRQVS
jgi:hypothetical protein